MATHNRAGEITYKHISGFTYEVTILTCTDISSDTNADREYMPIFWGHGANVDSIQRTVESIVIPNSVKRNEYTKQHTFPGPGTYSLYVEDPNRNGSINNIPESIDQVFSITTVLVISSAPALGLSNNSVQMFNPPKGDACIGALWIHNPAAFDPDGDSLSYEIVACTGADMQVIVDYTFPNNWPNPNEQGSLTIDQESGTVTWDSPIYQGEYNLCIKISEWREAAGSYFFMGSVIRDMQISVVACNNQPPELTELPDTCVIAGDLFALQIQADDPDDHDVLITLEGETFELANNPSIFTQTALTNPAQGTFQWNVDCNDVRLSPYAVYVTATDQSNQPADLVDVEFFTITVIAPAVENVQATVLNGTMNLSWDANACDNAIGYKIYRSIGSSPYDPAFCETGIPASTGYVLIDEVEGHASTDYIDTDVPFGFEVCYRVTACFEDGAESIVSEETCSQIGREIPVITHSSVGITDLTAGVDTVRWLAPNEIDTLDFTGPYFYKIYRTTGLAGTEELVETTAPTAILDIQEGFEYIDIGLNTVDFVYTYRVDFFNTDDNGEEQFVSSSNDATTIFLQVAPLDASMSLSWSDFQPWDNYEYEVWFLESGVFNILATTTETTFLHEGLVNGTEYCYFIMARGEYDPLSMISGPFLNFSQEKCGSPIDLTPPCPPLIESTGTCELGNYQLHWSDPNDFCADDVTEYNLYYAATPSEELTFLTTLVGASDTTFIPEEDFPIGCYAITALDTRTEPDGSLVMNESELSNTVCIDGCPEYMLPNVISPNQDEFNELFRPFDPWGYVSEVDLKIYNRWGTLMFETRDPQIDWDGTDKTSGQKVSDGVYYYHIAIFEITLEGIVPRFESGTIHVLDNKPGSAE